MRGSACRSASPTSQSALRSLPFATPHPAAHATFAAPHGLAGDCEADEVELKRLGLPIHGTKDILVERCRVHEVSCEGPGSAAGLTGSPSMTPTAATTASAAPPTPDQLQHPTQPPPRDAAASEHAPPSISMAGGAMDGKRAPFSKHERARLTQVMRHGELASGVIVSRGPMSRQQHDSRSRRLDVWVVVVAELFNGSVTFTVPPECADGGIDPNCHPVVSTGLVLRAKWTEVSS